MKSTLAAASTLLTLAAAVPQGGPPGSGGWQHGGAPGIFANFPSCVDSCWQQIQSSGCSLGDYSCYCSADTVATANKCVASSSCSDTDKENTYKAVAQLCANAGSTVTAAPEATWSVTSGKWPVNTAAWAPGGGAWNSLTGEAWSAFTSWTSAESITAFPTAASAWASFTSAHPLPADLSAAASWWSANGFPTGGSAWPAAWTTNSAWPSGAPFGPGGWSGAGGWGPFGHGGPGHGWGPLGSSGSWTAGPWTSWWGTGACPASTWSGELLSNP